MSDLQEGRYPNRLITTSSPYLLQHAYNPVDWFPWGAEALARAKREDRPILVSIGYATCHWCHVMERESFEDEGTALLMNREFICIKVDREERPDLDQVYMEAVQMITGSGGWPLNCFLTPDGRPFYGGTYFPPEPMGQRPSWTQVLSHMANLYREKRSVIETQADRLTAAIRDNQTRHLPSGLGPEAGGEGPDPTAFRDLVDAVMAERDARDGGFGPAPKFPRTMSMELLLAWSARTGEAGPADHVGFSLHKMIRGGIYDQIGGGLARYSTDKAWLVPHFEKMLYDQALFVDLLSKWIRYRPDPVAESAIRETLQFIEEHLTHPEGAFYAAIDADSEGVEGKYYVWQAEEFDRVVGKDAALWRDYLGVRVGGNWEGTNVLHRPEADPEFASRYGMSMEVLRQKWPKVRARLAVARSTRVPPIRDDKVILSWNALMIEALVSAYRALEEPLYLDRARRALRFIDRHLRRPDGGYDRIYAGDRSYQPAFLDDQAFLLRARIRLLEVGSDEGAWHGLETELQQIQNRFYDPERKAYLSSETSGPAGPMIDVLDSALPSGQAVMLEVLDLATSWSGDTRWSRLAEDLRHRLWPSIRKYPSSFAQSALSVLDAVWGRREIAVIGDQAGERLREVLKPYLPGTLVVASGSPSDLSILDGRYVSGKTYLYLCTDRSCRAPVETLDELLRP